MFQSWIILYFAFIFGFIRWETKSFKVILLKNLPLFSYSTGNKWRSRRRMLTPTFHYQIVKEYVSNFNEQALILVDVLRNEALKSQGKPINVSPHMTNCTMDIVCGMKCSAWVCKIFHKSLLLEISMGTKLGTMLRGECEYGKKLNE